MSTFVRGLQATLCETAGCESLRCTPTVVGRDRTRLYAVDHFEWV